MRSDLLKQEQDVKALLESLPPEVVGARLARARKRQGLSIRELAEKANVNKNSIVRLESGKPPQPLTVLKLCAAMSIHVATLADPGPGAAETVAVHRREEDRWYDLEDYGAGPLADRALSRVERRKLMRSAPMLLLRNRLESGQMISRVIELYRSSLTRSHLGEEMVYVLEGRLNLTIGGRSFDLEDGECATFWSAEPHSYAPAEGAKLPVTILCVTIYPSSKRP